MARKGKGCTSGMPSGYLAGHTEAHLDAHKTSSGHLSRTHENLASHLAGSAKPRTPMDEGSGRSTEDEENDV